MNKRIEQTGGGWRLTGGNLVVEIDRASGCLHTLDVASNTSFTWSAFPGNILVRDDLLRRTFDRCDAADVRVYRHGPALIVESRYDHAPWCLKEIYQPDKETLRWDAELSLDRGAFRSCSLTYSLPWPRPVYPVKFWAAREAMPSAPHRFAEIALEYGEITSGILLPALCSYIEQEDVGLLIAMPFDVKTPRFRFLSEYREPDLRMQFDRLALAPGKPARASLLFRGTGGAWRPALGWLYERYREYFEPRSTSIHDFWGGHVSGGFHVSPEEIGAMKKLGLAWHEIHGHFPAYGNYHPENISAWRSGHHREDETRISVDMIRQTIRNLHHAGVAAMPYLQVSGDGDMEQLDPAFEACRIRDIVGATPSAWPGTVLMNSDPSLPFGRDITRQIDGIVRRYPEIDGIFLDQACYNFLDTAHDDGVTAVHNRPAYMTGFNYFPHLEHLSRLLHPAKSIIANGPYGIGIMKYIDGFMAEGSGWLCDHLQYFGLAKPMFFLIYDSTDRDIELMFQRCLIYGAGYTSYAKAAASGDLYRKYVPLIETLYGRRWVFDPQPIELPSGIKGNVFRKPTGGWVAGMADTMPRLGGRALKDNAVRIQTAGIEEVEKIILHLPGEQARDVAFGRENGAIQFDLPGNAPAAAVDFVVRRPGETIDGA